MDNLNTNELKQASIKVLQDYHNFLGNDPESELQLVLDENNHHYLLLEAGWHKTNEFMAT
jgi:hypothetical protein